MLAGRFAITDVWPSVLGGRRPAAGAVGERIPVTATCFREGHDAIGVTVVLTDPSGVEHARLRAHKQSWSDTWEADVRPDAMGLWHFTIEAWGDPWETWLHRATIKVPAGIDADLELAEGAALLDRAAATAQKPQATHLATAARAMRESALPETVRLAAGTDPRVLRAMNEAPLREFVTTSGPWPLRVERRRALVGSWYEFFPRSEGATTTPLKSGTFATASKRLPAVAAMGFDVVYLPPIHPIGHINRKGPNNTLTPAAEDPGSPWAIGSKDGGHDAVHPDLGTIEDFDRFVTVAAQHDLEIALDLALQAAPDHPWVAAHPEWFTTRIDGSIAYAENPPKKYQDIYPLNFDNDPEGLYAEVERVVRFWVSHGVNIFRVDNPHTKPLWMWDRLISAINATNPDVIFLAEAFTRAPMMRALAEVGFQQSYTYFTWKNGKQELTEYASELAGPAAAAMRPNLFTNTPDILHEFLQHGGPAAFALRAVLAATLSPTYGVYSGYELYEHVALRPGSEEYLDTEKFQLRPRDWDAARRQGRTLAPFLTLLNQIRREHPALQDLRSLRFHQTNDDSVIAFSKEDADDLILFTCLLDPYREHATTVTWDVEALRLPGDRGFTARDLVSGTTWTWHREQYVRLLPWEAVAHIVHVPRESTTPRETTT
jgi:starch synthase (maltosyl-transferring)